MRRFSRFVLFLTLLLVSCAPQPGAISVGVSTLTVFPVPVTHAPEIRFALIGEMPQVNVWELFDGAGSTYTNRALLSGNFPRLYQLAPTDSSFQPLAADRLPSEVIQDGEEYSAIVKLRSDLKWTDGSPFTAEDVAFTANTILAFEFGYDWSAYYPQNYLVRAEALDPSTVKFIFKQKPNVGIWQYGILQAPIVQKAFWESAVQEAAVGLPNEDLRAEIVKFRASLEVAQTILADLAAQIVVAREQGLQNQAVEGDYRRKESEVVYLRTTLDNLLEDYAAQVKSAQEVLHGLDDAGEPTLGSWIPDTKNDEVWVNKANPDFPFGTLNFDRASYHFFEDENAALTAFENGDVDFVLSPVENLPNDAKYNSSHSARFLVFSPSNAYLADPAIRSALACMIDRDVLSADILQNKAVPLDSFVLSSQWHDSNLKDPCAGMDKSARVAYAVQVLKDAGYSWGREPDPQTAGQNLSLPKDGGVFPKVTLLAPSKDEDALRFAAAKYIAEQAQYLGIHFAVRETSLDEVVYAVYSSGKYDMALMGWRLSEYPAYLCEWFNEENPLFAARNSDIGLACETLRAETKLEAASQAVAQIESALLSELPFVPLFTVMQADVYRNLSYPMPNIPNGWTGLYGSPSSAVPMP